MPESKKDFNLNSRTWTIILTVLFTLLASPSLIQISSYIETTFYPVVSSFQVAKWERTADGSTYITGQYTRQRNCTFDHVNWYLKGTNSDIAIPIQRAPRDTDRPPGTYDFGPWKIYASPEELESDAYAIVYHQCHPLYDTQSIIYAKGQFK